jgi:hypothetical protein
MKTHHRKFIFSIVTCLLCFQSFAQDVFTFIKAGKLFDSEKGLFLDNQIIIIKNNLISEVG